uniref:Uncharacterized protein n=1 Tax=Ixodes ricinus TaxID=34613 RepID=A0A0K8RFD0_IXORI
MQRISNTAQAFSATFVDGLGTEQMLPLQHIFRSIASFVGKRIITFPLVTVQKKEKICNAKLLLLKHGAAFLHSDTLKFILT